MMREEIEKSQRLFNGLHFVHTPKVSPTQSFLSHPQSAYECSRVLAEWNELREWATFEEERI
jgi:hypothetical protein